MNNLGFKIKLHAKYQRPRPSGFRQEDFDGFPYISLCKNMWAPGRGHFRPQGYNLNNLDRGPQDKAVCQISEGLGLLVADKKVFKGFPYIRPC